MEKELKEKMEAATKQVKIIIVYLCGMTNYST